MRTCVRLLRSSAARTQQPHHQHGACTMGAAVLLALPPSPPTARRLRGIIAWGHRVVPFVLFSSNRAAAEEQQGPLPCCCSIQRTQIRFSADPPSAFRLSGDPASVFRRSGDPPSAIRRSAFLERIFVRSFFVAVLCTNAIADPLPHWLSFHSDVVPVHRAVSKTRPCLNGKLVLPREVQGPIANLGWRPHFHTNPCFCNPGKPKKQEKSGLVWVYQNHHLVHNYTGQFKIEKTY